MQTKTPLLRRYAKINCEAVKLLVTEHGVYEATPKPKVLLVFSHDTLSLDTRLSHVHPQLGPNPSFLDHEQLARGQSGKLVHGGTLYLVNQHHPFKLHYSPSTNRPAGSGTQTELKAEKTPGRTNGNDKDVHSSPNPKRTIKDFFSTSPMKVILLLLQQTKVCFPPYPFFVLVKMLKFYLNYDLTSFKFLF